MCMCLFYLRHICIFVCVVVHECVRDTADRWQVARQVRITSTSIITHHYYKINNHAVLVCLCVFVHPIHPIYAFFLFSFLFFSESLVSCAQQEEPDSAEDKL